MAKRARPRLMAVNAGMEPYTLHTRWRDGREAVVDLAGLITTSRDYADLCSDQARFRNVRLGADAGRAVWPDGVEMPAEILWRLAQEQTGQTMSAAAFRRWREGRSLTLEGAARALGLSRRMIAYYEHGSKAIPRVVALATRALDCEH